MFSFIFTGVFRNRKFIIFKKGSNFIPKLTLPGCKKKQPKTSQTSKKTSKKQAKNKPKQSQTSKTKPKTSQKQAKNKKKTSQKRTKNVS